MRFTVKFLPALLVAFSATHGSMPMVYAQSEGPTSANSSLEPTSTDSSEGPTTAGPTTQGPTTQGPTTAGPTTQGPTTQGPTTQGPTTPGPTTPGPTTPAPTTPAPTTPAPTTPAPTTPAPTTPAPTTPAPTTPAPTTAEPTAAPTETPIPKCKGKKSELLMIQVKTDKKSNKENKMNVKGREGAKGKFNKKVVARKKYAKKSVVYDYACIKQTKFCYQFTLTDKKGDGLKKGYVKLFIDGKKIYNNKFATGGKLVKKFGKCKKK